MLCTRLPRFLPHDAAPQISTYLYSLLSNLTKAHSFKHLTSSSMPTYSTIPFPLSPEVIFDCCLCLDAPIRPISDSILSFHPQTLLLLSISCASIEARTTIMSPLGY